MIRVQSLSVQYGGKFAVEDVSFSVPKGCAAALIGPNGCGKSTLLKAIAHMVKPASGRVFLDGQDSAKWRSRQMARVLAFLPQQLSAPADYTVRELVEFGRSPFLSFGQRMRENDRKIVEWAISQMNLDGFQERTAASLSGGERQRVWIAMRLAQKPEILLLDEPTTYLDIAAQYETLRLVRRLNRETGMTVLMVLHDLNQAAEFSDRIFAMRGGRWQGEGNVREMMSAALIRDVFGMNGVVIDNPVTGIPMFVPDAGDRKKGPL